MPTASSQPSADPAGATDGLSKAFDAAVESASLAETDFHAAAMQPETDTQPVEAETEPATEVEPGSEEAKAPAAEKATKVADPTATALTAPANWDAQRRDAFGKMDRAGQQILLDMAKGLEASFTKQSTELADDSRLAKGIRSQVSDLERQQMRNSGLNEVDAMGRLIQLNRMYSQNPTNYLRYVAQQANIDPRQAFPEFFTGQSAAPAPNGTQARTPDPNAQLYSALQPLVSEVQALRQSQQQREVQTAEQAIAGFRDGKAADGSALRPHFQAVENEMASLLQTPQLKGIADFGQRLQRAYDIAVANDGTLRQGLIDAEVQKQLAARQLTDRQKQDVAKARKAMAPVRSQPTGSVTAKSKGLDAALTRAFSDTGV